MPLYKPNKCLCTYFILESGGKGVVRKNTHYILDLSKGQGQL